MDGTMVILFSFLPQNHIRHVGICALVQKVQMAGAELQNATYQQSDTSNQKMKCTILILTFSCPNNMYSTFASEHKCKRYNKRGLIAKMPHSARLQAQLRK